MEKTGLKKSASAAKSAKTIKNGPKGAVTESRTFRDGLIYIYQRADFKKPTWLCRVKIPNGPGYVNRSTGTGDEHKAFKFADDLYNQLLVKSLTGEAPPSRTGMRATDFLKQRAALPFHSSFEASAKIENGPLRRGQISANMATTALYCDVSDEQLINAVNAV